MKPLIVRDKYQLDLRLGYGSYGEVYEGESYYIETGKAVALKLEYNQVNPSQLKNEVEIYRKLETGNGIPQVYWHGSKCEFRVMAFKLLGPSLENLFNYCGCKFSLKTYIHSKGYIYRDVKPDNLLTGTGTKGSTVYMTDIGLAKEIEDLDSINAHLGKGEYNRLYGSLPWQGLKYRSKGKEKMILKNLFNGIPIKFKKYFELIRSDKELDYRRLRCLFRDLFCRQCFQCDNVFDWTKLMILPVLQQIELHLNSANQLQQLAIEVVGEHTSTDKQPIIVPNNKLLLQGYYKSFFRRKVSLQLD
ncbi:kinase-like protein [Patellaria atrata CBS 101060]|uniref:non-specific serine/threonine protein kinase n=1 Tax=Patellaria atrata CBS 101060 TaxID=1346257 RepID=A0A9P4SC28_9PEZI|nr:kinase-like protein [Patellaria atrata CBS 101060]